jgi:hypothetical protein
MRWQFHHECGGSYLAGAEANAACWVSGPGRCPVTEDHRKILGDCIGYYMT